MKFFTNKNISKKIIIAIILVMSFNFISPAVSNAEDVGGTLFNPIGQLLVALGDVTIALLQELFLGNGAIRYTVADGIENYIIQYSPGVIFSNKVPGLDINFMNPQDDYEVTVPANWEDGSYSGVDSSGNLTKPSGSLTVSEMDSNFFNQLVQKNLIPSDVTLEENSAYTKDGFEILGVVDLDETTYYRYAFERNGKSYMVVVTITSPALLQFFTNFTGFFDGGTASNTVNRLATGVLSWFGQDNLSGILEGARFFGSPVSGLGEAVIETGWFDKVKYHAYYMSEPEGTGEYIESTASILQKTVATWYVALRGIAIVLLLSVLVYIGIRILISSTGETKARYKKMLMDWIAALCILFVLQYIMTLILEVTEKITQILVPYAVEPSGRDALMSNIRNRIFEEENSDFFNIFGYVLIYVTLVVFTITFTWKYLKRVIYMAFLTLIAPLISLTYPLDKVKDGQAQAFSMWLREYIFNALLQVVHLLVYCIFVGTGSEMLVSGNPLFAIAAIGFLIPAENFIKKLFGFDKANAGSVIGAAASGAFMMNMINNVKRLASKKGEKGEGGENKKAPRYVYSSEEKTETSRPGTSSGNGSSQARNGSSQTGNGSSQAENEGTRTYSMGDSSTQSNNSSYYYSGGDTSGTAKNKKPKSAKEYGPEFKDVTENAKNSNNSGAKESQNGASKNAEQKNGASQNGAPKKDGERATNVYEDASTNNGDANPNFFSTEWAANNQQTKTSKRIEIIEEPIDSEEDIEYYSEPTYSTYTTYDTDTSTQQPRTDTSTQQPRTDTSTSRTTTSGFNQKIKVPKPVPKRNVKRGVKSVAGRYFNKQNAKKLGKFAGKLGIGAGGALLTSIPAIAAGLTTGEPEKVLQYGATGAAAGYVGAQGVANRVEKAHRENLREYHESSLGTEEYETRMTIKKLIEDRDFNRVCKELGITGRNREELIRQFSSNGIKDSEDIKNSVNIMRQKPGTSKEDVIAAHKIKKEAQKYEMKRKDIREKLKSEGVPTHEVERAIDLIDML